jgi:heme/copper-type cytochrome/quinol oxidase subunit 4
MAMAHKQHQNEQKQQKHNHLLEFILGGFAGAISKTTIAPLERVKMIIQT